MSTSRFARCGRRRCAYSHRVTGRASGIALRTAARLSPSVPRSRYAPKAANRSALIAATRSRHRPSASLKNEAVRGLVMRTSIIASLSASVMVQAFDRAPTVGDAATPLHRLCTEQARHPTHGDVGEAKGKPVMAGFGLP